MSHEPNKRPPAKASAAREPGSPAAPAAPSTLGRLVRYGLVGLLQTAIYFGSVFLLVELVRVDPVASAVLATALVIVVAYFLHRRWVFNTDRAHGSAFPRFVAASMLSLALSAGIMHLVTRVAGAWYVIGLFATTVVVLPVNFVVNSWWSFRADKSAGDRAR